MDNLTINMKILLNYFKRPKNMMCFSSCNALVHLCHNNNDDDFKISNAFFSKFSFPLCGS
jgi:hypothetical protein